MSVIHVPLLAEMAALYALPRDPQVRFPRYLALLGAPGTVERPPLSVMNPMAKQHVADSIAACVSAGYEEQAQAWIDAALEVCPLYGAFRHGYGIADDIAGGWTTTADVEMKRRFVVPPTATASWLCTTLLASEPCSPTNGEAAVTATVARRAWQQRHGAARTLRQHLAQEQYVARRTPHPTLLETDVASVLACITPHLETDAYPILVAALLGDAAAASLGYAPIGAPPAAGLLLAAHPAAPAFA